MGLLTAHISRLRDTIAQSEASGSERTAAVVGADVPVELLAACGFSARRLRGDPEQPTPDADRYLGSGVDAPIRSIFQQLVNAEPDAFDAIVISNDNASHFRLYYALEAFQRLLPDWNRGRAPLRFFDLLHLPGAPTAEYNMVRATQLRDALQDCSEEALVEAIKERNVLRAQLVRLRDLRRERRVRGSDMLVIYRAFAILSPERFGSLLPAVLEAAADTKPIADTPIFLTGSAQDHDEYYREIEANGMIIVGEDHDWGDRICDAPVQQSASNPLAMLIERYRSGTPASAKFTTRARADYTAARARESGADALVALVRRDDPAPRWDVPRQRDSVAPLPLILMDDLPYACTAAGTFGREVAAAIDAARALV